MTLLRSSAAFLLCALAVSGRAQNAGQNINMVSGTTFPTGDPYLQRQNEPSIAASSRTPSRLLAGANDYRSVNIPAPAGVTDETGDAWLGVFKSSDGGQTWQSNLLPGYPQDTSAVGLASPLHGFTTGADPVVRAGTNGLFYYSGIAFNRGSNMGSVFVSRFVDLANKENGDPIQYVDASLIDSGTSGQFLDKPWLAVDIPRGSATCTIQTTQSGNPVSQTIPAGNAYITYSAFVGGTNNTHTQVLIARSTDCGQTWTKPVKISESYQVNQGSTLAIDPKTGTLYVAWRQFSNSNSPNAILVAKSADGGNTFSKITTAVSLPDFNPTTPSAPSFFDQGLSSSTFRSNAYPSIAVDGNGEVYLAWSQRGANGNPDARIVLTSSTDGVSWTTPTAIDNASLTYGSASFSRGSQLMPSVTIAGGKLMVLYYDLRLDHTAGVFTPNDPFVADPTTGLFYEQTRAPVGSDSPTIVFTPFISDANLGIRHTLDVRVSQADVSSTTSSASPTFTSSNVSQYKFGTLGNQQSSSDTNLHQLQVNPPNLPMFQGGTVPFMGDYIEIAGRTFLTPAETTKGWQFNLNAGGNPVGFATWTSNQDVRPPTNGDWTQTTSPDCPIAPTLDGSRNQNIYFSRITQGFSFSSPQQNKPLSTTLQRAFVLELFNSTDQAHSFALTIAKQPTGGTASFEVAPTPLPASLPTPVTTMNVTLAPHSGATRSVYALSSQATAIIRVEANEIPAPGETTIPGTPLSGFVVLNADPTAPPLTNPDSSTGDISVLELYTPNLSNPNISNPNISNPNISNPNLSNPNISNPNISNPNISNPNISNPNISNPNISNVAVANPNISNPNISNPNLSNAPVSDVNYTVTNTGNTNTGYQVRLVQLVSTLPGNAHIQLILSKNYTTPVSQNCQLTSENTSISLANLVNPTVIDYTQIGLNTSNEPDPEKNATMHLAPGETGVITIRGFVDLSTMQSVSTVLIPVVRAESAYSQDNRNKLAAPLTLVPANLSHALQGSSYQVSFVAFGGTAPYTWSAPNGLPAGFTLDPSSGTLSTVSAPSAGTYTFTLQIQDALGVVTTGNYSLIVVAPVKITTSSLPDAVVGGSYSAQLTASGGTPPITWSVSTGALPVGLSLDTASGIVSGLPTTAGTYTFTIKATDSTSGTPLVDQKSYTVHITVPLSASFTSLPDATLGQPYSYSLSVKGGTSPYVWSITNGSLPAGLSLSTAGVISGTPTTVNTAGTQITLKVQDSSNPAQSLSSNYVLRVGGVLKIATLSVPNGQIGVSYSTTLQSTGGLAPVSWSIASGTLPGGLSLGMTTGVISGLPNASGTFKFTAKVADSSLPAAQTATQSYSITIPKPLTVSFAVQPSSTSPNSQITPSLKVLVLDASGKAVSGATVVLTIEVNPGGSTLSGTTTATTGNNGIAIFASNSMNATGTGYELRATATSGTNSSGYAISAPFDVR